MNSNIHKYWLPLSIVFAWALVWKGIALWKSARQNDKAWFIALLIINTAGLLEIFYIFIFSNRNIKSQKEE